MAVNFRSLTTLVVDDSSHMRDILRSMLLGLGVQSIFEVGDGKAGLAAMKRVAPDLILIDWAMPAMDGIEFLREVRQKEGRFADRRIVMIAAFADPSKMEQAYAAGADELVPKPFSARALHAAIERAFLQRRAFVTRGDYFGPEMPGVAAAEKVGPGL